METHVNQVKLAVQWYDSIGAIKSSYALIVSNITIN